MQALVTGGAGFIGGHLAHGLVAEGAGVRCFDDLSAGRSDAVPPEADLIEGDIRDPAAIAAAAKGADVVYHQAAFKSVPRSLAMPVQATEVNVLGTLHVLLAAREAGARVVSSSSSSVYGDQDVFPLREDMSLRPKSPYAASKVAGEYYCATVARAWGVYAVSLRYFNVYGPGQDPASEYAAVVPRFIVACLTGTQPEINGDGEQSRDFTYVDDVVEANMLAGRGPDAATGEAFNVGAGREPTSVNELLSVIAELVGVEADPVYLPERPGDIRRSKADISKAQRLLGFAPRYDLRAGLARTVDSFRA